MKRILFFLLVITLLLLTSCKDKNESIGIWSEEGAYIYSNKGGNGKIVIEKDLMSALIEGGEESVEELFGGIEMYKVSPSEWRQREIVMKSLLSVTGKEGVESVYETERKQLVKSNWEENLDTISLGFDRKLMEYVKKNGGDFHTYNASDVVDIEESEKTRVFLKKWIKAIVG